jgi:hypothetical protein
MFRRSTCASPEEVKKPPPDEELIMANGTEGSGKEAALSTKTTDEHDTGAGQ